MKNEDESLWSFLLVCSKKLREVNMFLEEKFDSFFCEVRQMPLIIECKKRMADFYKPTILNCFCDNT